MCVLKMRWNDGIIIFINVLPLPSSNDCSFEKRIECDNICVITNTSIKMNLMELSFDFIVLYLTHISHINRVYGYTIFPMYLTLKAMHQIHDLAPMILKSLCLITLWSNAIMQKSECWEKKNWKMRH